MRVIKIHSNATTKVFFFVSNNHVSVVHYDENGNWETIKKIDTFDEPEVGIEGPRVSIGSVGDNGSRTTSTGNNESHKNIQ